MTVDRNFDMQAFAIARSYAEHLRAIHGTRNLMMDANEAMYKLRWADETFLKSKFPSIYITKSPDPKNLIDGIVRLLCATDPKVKVPKAIEGQINKALSSKIEKLCQATLRSSGRRRGDPVHFDALRSATIFDEVHIAVNSVKQMSELQTGRWKERAQEIAKYCPLIYDVRDPRLGFPDWDMLGLKAFHQDYKLQKKELLEVFGEYAMEALGQFEMETGRTDYDEYDISDFYDIENRFVYFMGSNIVILQQQVGKVIPIVGDLVQGSRLFSKPEDQREGILYALRESGMWNRQNLGYTSLFTKVAEFGLKPAMIYEGLEDDDEGPTIDAEGPVTFIRKPTGSRLEPWSAKGLIDEAAYRAIELASAKVEESTINRQALGAPLGSGTAYGTYALLGQMGRLPLVILQRKAAWALGDAIQVGLALLKEEGGSVTVDSGSVYAEVDTSQIPNHIEIEVLLDLALAQDKLSNVKMADMLKKDQLAGNEWIRENFLDIENSEEMDDEIMTELAQWAAFMNYMQQRFTQQPSPPTPLPTQGEGRVPMAAAAPGQTEPGLEGEPGGGELVSPEMMEGGMGEPMPPQMPGVGGGSNVPQA